MREQLIQYVQLLFAGTTDTDEIRQEILQNTLDRYDDLVEQGKSPEAAYRLAISGIGDINEILNNPKPAAEPFEQSPQSVKNHKLLRSIAIAMYILSTIPVILFDDGALGTCLTLLLVAAATALMVYTGKNKGKAPIAAEQRQEAVYSPKKQLRKAIDTATGLCGLFIYLGISFWSGAWYITWIIFPMLAAIQGLIYAIIDLKEACKNEN